MVENKETITSLYEYMNLVLKCALESWFKAGGSGGNWKVTDDKGYKKAKVETNVVNRISEKKDPDDEG